MPNVGVVRLKMVLLVLHLEEGQLETKQRCRSISVQLEWSMPRDKRLTTASVISTAIPIKELAHSIV